ncbi:MAG: VanZ family protein [Desulforhopalus sp.]
MGTFFWKYKWLFLMLFLFPWFFIGGPDYESPRLFKEAWNFGHILFFAIFTLETMRYSKATDASTRQRYITIMLLVIVLAISIEVCQSLLTERNASTRDIIFDFAGGFVVLAWQYHGQNSPKRKIFFRTSGSALVFLCMLPFILTTVDEYRAWRDFPVLSDFESFLDVSRWQGNGGIKRVKQPVKSGTFSLMATLTADKYSGVTLNHFPPNWSDAQALTFSVYNPGEPVVLNYRVHDQNHLEKYQNYSDRFNGQATLRPGWNILTIGMGDIENAPKNRKMDIQHIRGLGVFVAGQPVQRVLYIDDVKLLMTKPGSD